MNDERLTQDAASLFDDVEKWTSFLELAEMRETIVELWMSRATRDLRAHGAAPPPGWAMASWGNSIDTKWYLSEFGEKSVVIGFWNYDFTISVEDQIAFDIEGARRTLAEPDFSVLRSLFSEFRDPKNPEVIAYKASGMFHFGSPRDGHLSWDEFAWYAGHRTDEFVEQAMHHVERVTKNPEVMELMVKLNRAALTDHA